jgi:hypothetical protein
MHNASFKDLKWWNDDEKYDVTIPTLRWCNRTVVRTRCNIMFYIIVLSHATVPSWFNRCIIFGFQHYHFITVPSCFQHRKIVCHHRTIMVLWYEEPTHTYFIKEKQTNIKSVLKPSAPLFISSWSIILSCLNQITFGHFYYLNPRRKILILLVLIPDRNGSAVHTL